MTYLVLGEDGSIGGYTRADILLCDYAVHSKDDQLPKAIWRRTDSLQSVFAPSSIDEVKRDLEAASEPLVSRELVTGLERIEQAVDRALEAQ
jgi:hypothetical protein